MTSFNTFSFLPYLSSDILLFLAALMLAAFTIYIYYKRRFPLWIFLAQAFIFLCLLNPVWIKQDGEKQRNIALIIQDQSASIDATKRTEISDALLQDLAKKVGNINQLDIETRQYKATADQNSFLLDFTFQEMETLDQSRLAGVFILTDGQIHDQIEHYKNRAAAIPMHFYVIGEPQEKDLRITISQQPEFGIIGQSVQIEFILEASPALAEILEDKALNVELRHAGKVLQNFSARLNEAVQIPIPIENRGENFFVLHTPVLPDEITAINNNALLQINGVRDRMNVLLVSGFPYNGARTWRNLLKSDPNIDLVHFTILRTIQSLDQTPDNELSLIPFPVHELFEEKLYDFDLIIFDRYTDFEFMIPSYLFNIANFVEQGGAFLGVVGNDNYEANHLFNSPLSRILPAAIKADGGVKQRFSPQISPLGQNHPVTAPLANSQDDFGSWLFALNIEPSTDSQILLERNDTNNTPQPLLAIKQVEKGRAGLFASDHIWLWARNFESGGTYLPLMRRLIHWLMKEPSLEAEQLEFSFENSALVGTYKSTQAPPESIEVTMPDQTVASYKLEKSAGNDLQAQFKIEKPDYGLYLFETENLQRAYMVGSINSLEFQKLHATTDIIKPFLQGRQGSLRILNKPEDSPAVRIQKNAPFNGRNWVSLKDRDFYIFANLQTRSLLPPYWAFAIGLALLLFAWHRESRA